MNVEDPKNLNERNDVEEPKREPAPVQRLVRWRLFQPDPAMFNSEFTTFHFVGNIVEPFRVAGRDDFAWKTTIMIKIKDLTNVTIRCRIQIHAIPAAISVGDWYPSGVPPFIVLDSSCFR